MITIAPNLPGQSRRPAGSRLSLVLVGSLVVGGLSACGGVTQFSDTTPLSVKGAAPAPAPAPAPAAPKRVAVTEDHVEIDEKIQFQLDSDEIKSESFGLLDEVVAELKEHVEIKKLEIIGHTDSDGAEDYNQKLSERRAKAVLEYLVKKGIDAGRLSSKGMGESKPIADNETAAGKEKNRRVEFLIVEMAKGGN